MFCFAAQPGDWGYGGLRRPEGGPTLEYTSSCPRYARDFGHIVEQEVGVTGVSSKVGAMAEETPQPGGHCLIVHRNRLGTDVKLVPRQGPIAQHAYPAGREALAPSRLESQPVPTQQSEGYTEHQRLRKDVSAMTGQMP